MGDNLMDEDDFDQQTVCIVALPRPTDPIRLVGKEEKHATLIFLGKTEPLPKSAKIDLLNTIATVSNMFQPFSEGVTSVENLGSNTPPALVAMLTDTMLSKIRNSLMVNPMVTEYMMNATQYPTYTPHVTLDYPETDSAYDAYLHTIASQLTRVRFDRLALWWNGEQIEFDLDTQIEVGPNSIQMSDFMYENSLEHSGVKGMRWGQRKKEDSGSDSSGVGKPGTVEFHTKQIALLKKMGDDIRSGKLPSKTGTPDKLRLERNHAAIKEHEDALKKITSGGMKTAKIDKTTTGYTKNLGPGVKLKDADYSKAEQEVRLASYADATKSGKTIMGVTDFHENGDGTVSVTRIAREMPHDLPAADYVKHLGPLNDKFDRVILNHEGYFK